MKLNRSLETRFPYLGSFSHPSPVVWWQVPYAAATIFGAYLMSLMPEAKHVEDNVSGVEAHWAFIGGFLLLFGARMAGGCTSGHGLSGVAVLQVHSIVAVGSMFVGGIGTAVIWHFASDNGRFLEDAPHRSLYPGC